MNFRARTNDFNTFQTCFFLIPGSTNRRYVYDAEEKISKMLKLFQEHVHNKFNKYAFGFFLCELTLYCVNLRPPLPQFPFEEDLTENHSSYISK